MNLHPTLRRWPFETQTTHVWLAVLAIEALLLVGYFVITPAEPSRSVRYLVYPFAWINAGLWAVYRTDPQHRNRLHRLLGVGLAGAYYLLLMYIPGNIGFGAASASLSFRIGWYAPGWGPLIAANSPWIRLFLIPFEVIGYAGLGYLVYANVLTLTRGIFSGALGLVTCVGCTVPVIAPLVGLLGGPASSLTTTAYAWSYDIGTIVFLLVVGLLYWSHRRNRA